MIQVQGALEQVVLAVTAAKEVGRHALVVAVLRFRVAKVTAFNEHESLALVTHLAIGSFILALARETVLGKVDDRVLVPDFGHPRHAIDTPKRSDVQVRSSHIFVRHLQQSLRAVSSTVFFSVRNNFLRLVGNFGDRGCGGLGHFAFLFGS